jgi:hypothetical protein
MVEVEIEMRRRASEREQQDGSSMVEGESEMKPRASEREQQDGSSDYCHLSAK